MILKGEKTTPGAAQSWGVQRVLVEMHQSSTQLGNHERNQGIGSAADLLSPHDQPCCCGQPRHRCPHQLVKLQPNRDDPLIPKYMCFLKPE